MRWYLQLIILTVSAMAFLNPSTVYAQTAAKQRVVVLPFAADEVDLDLSRELYDGFLEDLRIFSWQELASSGRVAEMVDNKSVTEIIEQLSTIEAFVDRTGTAFLVGGIVRRLEDGRIEVYTLIYSDAEKRIRDVQNRIFEDEDEARSSIGRLGYDITHPRNYSPSDTSFFYSLLVPGMGQLQQGAPAHAVLSAGMVFGAILYGVTTPRPDEFKIKWENYQPTPIPGTTDYRFLIQNQEVPEEEFYRILSEDRRRSIIASAERRAAASRKKRATRLLVGAYIFNLVDTLLLTRRDIDTRSFFIRLEAVSDDIMPYTQYGFQLRIGLRIK